MTLQTCGNRDWLQKKVEIETSMSFSVLFVQQFN